jgi:predicted dinucleotide-binding enzyme
MLGSGLMGGKLGTLFARAGHEVVFSYSRDPAKLLQLAEEAGNGARAATPRQSAENADVLLLAVHWSRIDNVLTLAGSLKGKIIVTTCLPMNQADTALVIGKSDSGAEVLSKRARGASVVSAFGTIPSEVLFDVYARRRRKQRPSLIYCGDTGRAKTLAARLIRDVGFDPVDVGPLRMARYAELFTLLMGQIAYEGKGGPAVAYRIERY